MCNPLRFCAILSSVLLLAAFLGPCGRTAPSAPIEGSAETKMNAAGYLYYRLKQNNVVNVPGLPITIFVKKFQGRTLVNPVLKHKDAHGKVDYVCQARTAELSVRGTKKQLIIHLHQGKAICEDGDFQVWFTDKAFAFDLPKNFGRD